MWRLRRSRHEIGPQMLKLWAVNKCSCYVLIARLGSVHGSIIRSPQTPAGEGAALRAGGRICRRLPPSLLGVAVEFERRRGRGAQSNASGRYEPLARIAFDDGWRTLDELPPFKTTVHDRRHPQDHHPQRLARHRLRPLDQSLSRLRARLRLLLRAPDPRLSRPVARARFRIQIVREAGGGRTAGDANCRRPAIGRR